ncbi:MAG: alkaline phosphatase, partial [Planctomycetota bacterium]
MALTQATPERPTAPRSVIFLIGDGMGPQQVGLLLDWAAAAGKTPTALERLMNRGTVGLLRTAALNSPLTDSAAAATALACGVSTNNGKIAMAPDGTPLPTCLEAARDSGRRTALVTTTRLSHATPACFAAHVPTRLMEPGIARQYLEKSQVDVLLGGGSHFIFGDPSKGGQDLSAMVEEHGYRVVRTREELRALPATSAKVLGVFAEADIPYLLDRDAEGEAEAPTLAEMTQKA